MRAVKERRRLKGGKSVKGNAGNDAVRVIVRVRPLLPQEQKVSKAVVYVKSQTSLQIRVSKDEVKQFKFTACVGPGISQADFFEQCGVKTLVDSSLQGYAATIFAYGQTGSGKTFSMSGVEEKLGATLAAPTLGDETTRGVIPRSVLYLFRKIKEINDASLGDGSGNGSPGALRIRSVEVRASFAEIYNEQVFDLLNSTQKSLSIREDTSKGFYVQGLSVFTCDSAADMLAVLQEGHRNRRVGSHNLNKDSSRSHSLLSVYVTSKVGDVKSAVTDDDNEPEHQLLEKKGKIVFVDLAGSERLRDTGTKGKHLKETTNINKSLFTLGKVISTLSKGQTSVASMNHIPYRDSKLTMLLKDSLGGNCKTLMVACVSPAKPSLEESLSTLNYATRAKNIVNKPVLMMDPKEKLLLHYKNEIRLLKLENEYLREQQQHHHHPPHPNRHDYYDHHHAQHHMHRGGQEVHGDQLHLPSIHEAHPTDHLRGENMFINSGPSSRMHTSSSAPSTSGSARSRSDATWQVQRRLEQLTQRLAECEDDNNVLRKQKSALEDKLTHLEEVFVGDIAQVVAPPAAHIPSGKQIEDETSRTLELQDTIHHLRIRETQLMAEVARLRRAVY